MTRNCGPAAPEQTRRAPHALITLAALGLCAPAARAQNPAVSFTDGNSYTQGSYSLGWKFTPNSDLTVSALGFYDDFQNGLIESHAVGIFDAGNGSLVASATIDPTDTLTGFFRYKAIAPVTLAANSAYYAMAVTGAEGYATVVTDFAADPGITFEGFAFVDNPNVSGLLFPDTEIAGYPGDFGPNFKFSAVPGPNALVTSLAGGLPGVLLLWRRRNSRK